MAALRPTVLPRAVSSLATASAVCLRAQPFSTSANACASRIPPESPRYINVPNPPQDQSIEARRELSPVRGHLPVPRKVFRWKSGDYEPTQDVLDSLAAEPTSESSKQPPRSDKQAWKRSMALKRRENVRAGIQDLWERKVVSDKKVAESRALKVAQHRRAASAPESEGDRLTRASIDPETLKTAVAPDPLRFERALASKAKSDALEQARSERRIDAVQELYMNARSFIVTEKELEELVEKEFAPDYFSSMGMSNSGRPMYNVWDLQGKPKTMTDMMKEVSRSTSDLLQSTTADATRTLKRQKLVAEQLTGGKMD
ncbi:hypothetical protein Micbo1qcDRAFT_165649 [Microdochium bolleyi]|uniref:Uncharacterized protein n=1 Tax=Microdochium bolleyi TaxID=196109 RepID=A0A136IXF4_9PEZI|nr:hypothetical protein Micbo1qcDRAFT_165649 [Microdochium bolleyi]